MVDAGLGTEPVTPATGVRGLEDRPLKTRVGSEIAACHLRQARTPSRGGSRRPGSRGAPKARAALAVCLPRPPGAGGAQGPLRTHGGQPRWNARTHLDAALARQPHGRVVVAAAQQVLRHHAVHAFPLPQPRGRRLVAAVLLQVLDPALAQLGALVLRLHGLHRLARTQHVWLRARPAAGPSRPSPLPWPLRPRCLALELSVCNSASGLMKPSIVTVTEFTQLDSNGLHRRHPAQQPLPAI